MDPKAKRAPRPVKTTNVKPVSAPVVEPVACPLPAPVSAPVEVPVEVPAAAEVPVETPAVEHSAEKSTRTQTNKAIGVSISFARVRRHIDKLNLNATLDAEIKKTKDQLALISKLQLWVTDGKAVVEATKDSAESTRDLTPEELAAAKEQLAALLPEQKTLELRQHALSRERIRFSNEASIALSIVCDELVQELVTHSISSVLALKKRIIQVNHLHKEGVELLPLFPLIKTLPTFTSTAARLAKVHAEELYTAQVNALLRQAEKDFKKKYNVKAKKEKREEPVVEAVPEAEPVSDEEPSDSKTSFRFYVHQVCKDLVKTNPEYKSIRISTEIREYLSDLLIEVIQRLAPLVYLTTSSMKNKTVNCAAILRTIECLLVDGHHASETIEFVESSVRDPALVKAEYAKRDDEKKAGRDYKVFLDDIPSVAELSAVRTVSFPTSEYSKLADKIHRKLELYSELPQKDKAEAK